MTVSEDKDVSIGWAKLDTTGLLAPRAIKNEALISQLHAERIESRELFMAS
jgi:hypothetical protein